MADSTNVLDLPDGFDLYGGYDDGNWPDADAIEAAHPGKTVVRFTTDPRDNEGDCLDIENGDANPDDAPPWTLRRRQAGHRGPLNYFSESSRDAVTAAFEANPVTAQPPAFVAAYPGAGAVLQRPEDIGHQWIDRGGYDESVVVDHLPGIDPDPVPLKPMEDDMDLYATDSKGTGWVIDSNLSSKRGIIDGPDAAALLATELYKVVALTDPMIAAIPGT
jgi:hypothetical protein